MKTILVSGASGIVGYGILRSLKNSQYNLIGTTIYETSPANCFANIVLQAPMSNDQHYIPWLVKTIKKYNIDMIIPGIEADMSVWNKNREIIEQTGTFILLNNSKLIELCLDKWDFYSEMKKNKFNYTIKSSLNADFNEFKIPFLLKPRCGFGSKGIVKIDNKETFEKYKNKIGNTLMMQEYVGTNDEEYTVSAFFDKNSCLKAYISMKRKLSKQGYTEIAKVVDLPNINNILLELAKIFKPIGPTNFQFRRDKTWKLLEINPRISSSTSLKSAFGYNECEMSVKYFLDKEEISQPSIKKGSAIRYTEDYIFYDCDNI